jgi:hypothetical protein
VMQPTKLVTAARVRFRALRPGLALFWLTVALY